MYKDERLKIEPKSHKTFKANWWNLLDADWAYNLCAFTNYSADKKGPFIFFFYTTSASPSKRASLDGSCLHLPAPQCRMPKDTSCWEWSAKTWTFRLGCPTTRCQSKNQVDLCLCRGQHNEQRAAVIFPRQSKLLEAKWESLGLSQPNLGLEEKSFTGQNVCCPAQKLQMWISMAYPTSDGGEYKLAARCGWKEVPGGAAWLPRSSKAPGGALCTLWGALPTPSLENLKNSLKHLC